ncbi:MAG: TadE/TadG family type IV pilus assembly protein [Myxococcota bacterium]
MRGGIRSRGRRGNTAIVVAVSCTTFLMFVALTVDLGFARMVRQQLENTSEAAARAGSFKLDGTEEGLDAARQAALDLAAANPAGGRDVLLDRNEDNDADGDIVLGYWDDEDQSFTPSDEPELVDTVQVRARIPDLTLFFAQVAYKKASTPVSAQSRALVRTSGAGAVECFIPLALPDCVVDRYAVDGLQDITLKLNPAGIDNVGWGRPNASPNADWTRAQIEHCEQEGEIHRGDPVGLQNGVVQSALDAMAVRVNASTTRWDTAKWGTLPARDANSGVTAANWGKTYEGPILVFDGGSQYCVGSGGTFSGTEPLDAFLWGAVYEVVNKGKAEAKTVRLRVDVRSDYDFGTDDGGPDYGVEHIAPPRLVRND